MLPASLWQLITIKYTTQNNNNNMSHLECCIEELNNASLQQESLFGVVELWKRARWMKKTLQTNIGGPPVFSLYCSGSSSSLLDGSSPLFGTSSQLNSKQINIDLIVTAADINDKVILLKILISFENKPKTYILLNMV